jgi:hypothetical protein
VGKAIAYIAFADRSLPSAEVKIYSFLYYSGGSMVQAAVNLSANQPWSIYRDPDIAAAGSEATSRVYGAFTAGNAATSGVTQIFNFNYSKNEGTASPATTMLTSLPDYPKYKSSPQVVIIHDDIGGTPTTEPVIAWRSSQVGSVFDMYLYNRPSLIRKIFTTRAGVLMQGDNSFDLAGNGKTAGGVWIDERGPSDPRLVPWVSVKGSQVFIPLAQKGQTYQNDPQ